MENIDTKTDYLKGRSEITRKERGRFDPWQILSSSLDAADETWHTMFIFHLSDVRSQISWRGVSASEVWGAMTLLTADLLKLFQLWNRIWLIRLGSRSAERTLCCSNLVIIRRTPMTRFLVATQRLRSQDLQHMREQAFFFWCHEILVHPLFPNFFRFFSFSLLLFKSLSPSLTLSLVYPSLPRPLVTVCLQRVVV